MSTVETLELVCERKICDLVSQENADRRWEASGVLAREGQCYVVFDNSPDIGRFSVDLQNCATNRLFTLEQKDLNSGYEGIAYNKAQDRFYLLIEARKHARNHYRAIVVECDNQLSFLKERPLQFKFESSNKGFEAIAHVRQGDQDFVLALCEGNYCQCGAKGRKPGGGRVQLFEKKKKHWAHAGTIDLPKSLPFIDYSGMSIDQGRVAIVSQVNSMLWIGQFDRDSWTWHDAGQLYAFPRSERDEIRYGNIEGVAWLSPTRIAAVSDRRKKKNQPDKALKEKDQSLHIFEIPSQKS